MSKGIEVMCSRCGERMLIDPDAFGLAVRCVECGEWFPADDSAAVPADATPVEKDAGLTYTIAAPESFEAGRRAEGVVEPGETYARDEAASRQGAGWLCPSCETTVSHDDQHCPFCGATRTGKRGTIMGADPEREVWRKRLSGRKWGYTGPFRALSMALFVLSCLAVCCWVGTLFIWFSIVSATGALAAAGSTVMSRRAMNGDCSFWHALFGVVGVHMMAFSAIMGHVAIALASHAQFGSSGAAILLCVASLVIGTALAWTPFRY